MREYKLFKLIKSDSSMGADQTVILKEALKNPENKKALQKSFQFADTNGDGELSKEEFLELAKTLHDIDISDAKKQKKSFLDPSMGVHILDSLKDENITKYFKKLFEAADANNDGTITFDEFEKFILSHSQENPLVKLEINDVIETKSTK